MSKTSDYLRTLEGNTQPEQTSKKSVYSGSKTSQFLASLNEEPTIETPVKQKVDYNKPETINLDQPTGEVLSMDRGENKSKLTFWDKYKAFADRGATLSEGFDIGLMRSIGSGLGGLATIGNKLVLNPLQKTIDKAMGVATQNPQDDIGVVINKFADHLESKIPEEEKNYMYQVASALGSSAPYLVGGAVAGALKVPAMVINLGASGMEALTNAYDDYTAIKKKGDDESTATLKALGSFGSNLAVNFVTNKLGWLGKLDEPAKTTLGAVKNFITSGLLESGQETTQQLISNIFQGNPTKADLASTFLVSLPVSLPFGAIGMGGNILNIRDNVKKEANLTKLVDSMANAGNGRKEVEDILVNTIGASKEEASAQVDNIISKNEDLGKKLEDNKLTSPTYQEATDMLESGTEPIDVKLELSKKMGAIDASQIVDDIVNDPTFNEKLNQLQQKNVENAPEVTKTEQTTTEGNKIPTPNKTVSELQTDMSSEMKSLNDKLKQAISNTKTMEANSAEKKQAKIDVENIRREIKTSQDNFLNNVKTEIDTLLKGIKLSSTEKNSIAGEIMIDLQDESTPNKNVVLSKLVNRAVEKYTGIKTLETNLQGEVKDVSYYEKKLEKVKARPEIEGIDKKAIVKYYEGKLEEAKKSQPTAKEEKISSKLADKSQKEKVAEAVKEKAKTIKEIAQETKIKEPNVRRILGVGAKEGTFERVEKGVYILKKDGQDIAFIEAGSALEVLPRLAKEGFKADMVFLDIPYKTPAITGGNRKRAYTFISVEEFGKVLDSVKEIARNDNTPIIHMFSQAPSGMKAMMKYNNVFADKGFIPVGKGELLKLNQNGTPVGFPARTGYKITEPEGILVFTKDGTLKKDLKDLNFKLVRPKGYDTEKPAQMLKEMIEMTTDEGDTVLDPFAGSGVTGAEAVKAGRLAYLIEKNADVAENITKKRVSEAIKGGVTRETLEEKEKYQKKVMTDIRQKGYVTSEQALEEALKIPLFKELNARGQVKLAEQLSNPKALGSYYNEVIKYVKNPHNTTLPHETFHAFFDMVLTQEEQKEALNLVREDGMSDLQSEEKLAQEFANWYLAENKKTKFQKFFDKIANFFKEIVSSQDEIKSLFARVVSKQTANKINQFKNAGGIEQLRAEYNQNPNEFTTQLFEDDQIWKKDSVKRATIIGALGRLKKPLMKDFVANKLDIDFKGQETINTAELKRSIQADLLDMKIIPSETYSDYGLDNIGVYKGNVDHKTYIINTNFKHGRTGHFSGQFDIRTTKEDLEIRKIEAGKHEVEGQIQDVKKDEYYVTRKDINRETLEEGTFAKFDTEKEAQDYINKFSDRVTEEAGMLGHFRAFNDGEKFNVTEIQSDIFQKGLASLYRTNERLMKSDLAILDERIKEHEQELVKIKEGLDRGDIDEANFNRKTEYVQEAIDKAKSEKEKVIKRFSTSKNIHFSSKVEGKAKSLGIFIDSLKGKIKAYEDEIKKTGAIQGVGFEAPSRQRFNLDWYNRDGSISAPDFYNLVREYGKELPVFEELYGNERNANGALDRNETSFGWGVIEGSKSEIKKEKEARIKKFNAEFLPKLKEAIKELDGVKTFSEELDKQTKKGLNAKQQKEVALSEQFLSFKNNYHEIIINSALRQGAMTGAETIKFPSPYTVANIEGYIDKNGDYNEGYYSENDIRDMSTGDNLEVMGYNGMLLSYGINDYEVAYTSEGDLRTFSFEDAIDDQRNRWNEEFNDMADQAEVRTEMEEWVDENIEDEKQKTKLKKMIDDFTDEEIRNDGSKIIEKLSETEELSQPFEYAKEKLIDSNMENYNVQDDMESIYGENGYATYEDENRNEYVVVSTEGGDVNVETQGYKTAYEGDAESFKLSDIPSDDHRTIASKYGIGDDGKEGEFYKYLKKKRPDLTEVTDDNGFTWYETKVKPEDKMSVEMFQNKDNIGKQEDINNIIFNKTKSEIESRLETIFGRKVNLEEVLDAKKDLGSANAYASTFRSTIKLLSQNGSLSEVVANHEGYHWFKNNLSKENLVIVEKMEEEYAKSHEEEMAIIREKYKDVIHSEQDFREELMADVFSEYYRTGDTVFQKIKKWFKIALDRLSLVFGNKDQVLNVFLNTKSLLDDSVGQVFRTNKSNRFMLGKDASKFTNNETQSDDFENIANNANDIVDKIPTLEELIETKMIDVETIKDNLDTNPARQLEQYSLKGGFLPEVTGDINEENEFARNGEAISKALGYEDVESAREAFEQYIYDKKQFNNISKEFSSLKKLLKQQNKELSQIEKEIKDKLNSPQFTAKQVSDAIMKSKKKGLKEGYKSGVSETRGIITNQLKNIFNNKLADIKRSGELSSLKEKILSRQEDSVRNQITEYIKTSLPSQYQGRYISLIKNSSTYGEMIKAFTKIDTAVDIIERKQAVKMLAENAKKILNSKSISVDYKEKARQLIKSIDFTTHRKITIDRLRKMRNFIESQKKLGNDITLPESVLETLQILEKRNISDMTKDQIVYLANQMETIYELGLRKQAVKKDLYEMRKNRIKKEVVSGLRKIESLPILTAKDKDLTSMERFKNSYRKISNTTVSKKLITAPMDIVFDIMSGKTGTFDGVMNRLIKAPIDLHYGAYLNQSDEIKNRMYALIDELDVTKPEQFRRIGVHGAIMQEGGKQKLIDTGWTEEQINNSEAKLTENEMKLYRAMLAEYEKLHPLIEKTMHDVYNEPLGKVKNYMPFMTDFEAMADSGSAIEDMMVGRNGYRDFATKNPEKGFTKERKLGTQGIKINALQIFEKHIDNTTYLINMAETVKMTAEIVNSKEFEQSAGDIATKIARDWTTLVSQKGGSNSQGRIKIFDFLRRRISLGILGLRLSSALIQPTAIFDGASEIGTWAFYGAEQVATSRDVRAFIQKNMPEVRDRIGDDPAYVDFGNSKVEKYSSKIGLWAMKNIDAITASSVAYGAYMKKIKQMGLELDLEKPNAEAIAYAEKVMRKTQASSQFKDIPLAISAGKLTGNLSFDKVIFQFQSFTLNRVWKLWYDGIETGIAKKGGMGKGLNTLFYLTLATMAGAGIRQMLNAFLAMLSGSDKEDEKNFLTYFKNETLNQIPFLSNIINATVYDGSFLPATSPVVSTIQGIQQFFTSKKTSSKMKGGVDFLSSLGVVGGIAGSSQAGAIAKTYIKDKEDKLAEAKKQTLKDAIEKDVTTAEYLKRVSKVIQDSTGKKITPQAKGQLERTYKIYREYGMKDKKVIELEKAQSNDDKVIVLQKYKEEMGGEFSSWIMKAKKVGLVSDDLYKKYKQAND